MSEMMSRGENMRDPRAAKPELVCATTREPREILAAQRLRYEVFAEEMGARLPTAKDRLDTDAFDAHCAHLLVREGQDGRVVACARLLDDEGARRAGGFYSQGEFDLGGVLSLPGRFLEVGRTCVARDRRDGATLSALWSGLAREASACGADYLIGCASVPFDPRREALAPLKDSLRAYWVDDGLRARPHRPVPRDPAGAVPAARLPPLLAAYLRLGAKIGGQPSWDPDFGTADFFVVVAVARLAERYARRFLGRAASVA